MKFKTTTVEFEATIEEIEALAAAAMVHAQVARVAQEPPGPAAAPPPPAPAPAPAPAPTMRVEPEIIEPPFECGKPLRGDGLVGDPWKMPCHEQVEFAIKHPSFGNRGAIARLCCEPHKQYMTRTDPSGFEIQRLAPPPPRRPSFEPEPASDEPEPSVEPAPVVPAPETPSE